MQGHPLSVLKYPLPLEFLKDIRGKAIPNLFIAGGAVRDSILGIPPNDIDFYPTTPEALASLLEVLHSKKIRPQKSNDILLEGTLSYVPFPKFQEDRWTGSFDIILHCIESITIEDVVSRFDFAFNKALVSYEHEKVFVEHMPSIQKKTSRFNFDEMLNPIKHFNRAMKFLHDGYELTNVNQWFEKFTQLSLKARTDIGAFVLLLVINKLTPKNIGIQYTPRIDLSTHNISYDKSPEEHVPPKSEFYISTFLNIKEDLYKYLEKKYGLAISYDSMVCTQYDDIVFNRIHINEGRFKLTQEVINKYLPSTTTSSPDWTTVAEETAAFDILEEEDDTDD